MRAMACSPTRPAPHRRFAEVVVGGVWTLDYTLQNGLNLGVPYVVPGLPTSLDPATDGLRNITGMVNGDGSVTLFGITSTVSASGDQGADPDRLVAITDNLSFLTATQAANQQFSTLKNAGFGKFSGAFPLPANSSPLPDLAGLRKRVRADHLGPVPQVGRVGPQAKPAHSTPPTPATQGGPASFPGLATRKGGPQKASRGLQ